MRYVAQLIILFLVLGGSTKVLAQARSVSVVLDRGDLIEDLLLQYYELYRFNGSVLVAEDSEVLFENTLGLADFNLSIPLDAEIPFYLASLSKQFTAAAIMKLTEEDKVNLDDPLRHYLPQLPEFYTEVKISNLLNHTSGITDYLNTPLVSDGLSNQEVFEYLKNIRKLEFTPGTKFRYSNSAYALLAMVIEEAGGQSFEAYLANEFFTPLGMDNSFVLTPATASRPRVLGFDEKENKQDYTLLTVGDGGVYSTTKDLFLWTEALNQGKIISFESLEAMYAPVKLKSGREKRYGYGWELGNNKTGPFVYHSGQLVGFRTYLEYQQSTGKTIIILTNTSFEKIADLRNQLVKILDGRITNISEE